MARRRSRLSQAQHRLVVTTVAGLACMTLVCQCASAYAAPKLPAGSSAATTPAQAGTGVVDELTTENNLVTTDGQGNYTLQSTLLPSRVKVDGTWQPIDTTLRVRSDGRIEPTLTAEPVTFSAGGADTTLLEQTAGSATYAVDWDVTLPAPSLKANTATYSDVAPGIDLQLTATPVGFTQVLVVHNAAAAADPLLDDVVFTASVRDGQLDVADDGSFQVLDAEGTLVLQGPSPSMWDSTIDAAVGPTPTAAVVGSGDQTTIPVEVTVAAPSEAELAISPSEAALAGPDTQYPLFIDPPASGVRQAYLELLSNGDSYFNDPNWNPKVGLCEWAGCNNIGVGRALMQYDLSAAIKGTGTAKVANARLYVQQIHNATGCTAQPVALHGSGAFNASTAWPGPFGAALDTRSSAAGDSCGGPGNVIFASTSLDDYVESAVNANRSNLAFGLKAPNEEDRNQWKQFSNAISNSSANVNVLEFDFNYPPFTPSGITVSHGNTCEGVIVTEDQRPAITYSAKDGNVPPGSLRIRTQLYPGNGRNGYLQSGGRLESGERVTTTVASAVYFVMQTDGNLVLYSRGSALWSSRTFTAGSSATMQTDGNLVVRAPSGAAVWNSATFGNPGAGLVVQSDGNVVIYDGPAIWSTRTQAPLPAVRSASDPVVNSEVPTTYNVPGPDLGSNSWRVRLTGWTAANTAVQQWGPTRDVQFETIKTDDTPPTVTTNNVARNNWTAAGGTFTLSSDDPNVIAFAYTWTGEAHGPVAPTECSYNSGGLVKAVNGRASISTNGLAVGPNTLVVTTVNRAHGMSNPSTPYTFYIAESGTIATSLFEGESAASFPASSNSAATTSIDPCADCSGGQLRRLGGASGPAVGDTFTFATSLPVEADYALGAWVRTGPGRPKFTVAIEGVTTPAQEVNGAAQNKVYDPSAAVEGLFFIPLGGAHLAAGSRNLSLTIVEQSSTTPKTLEIDSITAANFANTTMNSFAEALNNDGIGPDNSRPNIAPNADSYGLSSDQMHEKYPYLGQNVTINDMTFPMPNEAGVDNVIAAGQIITLPAVRATSVNLLVTSTCGPTPTGANTTATLTFLKNPNNVGRSPADRRIPSVPDWVAPTDVTDVTTSGGQVTMKLAQPTMDHYLFRGGTTTAADVKIYTMSIAADPAYRLGTIRLPNYGSTFLCSTPSLHVLSIGTTP